MAKTLALFVSLALLGSSQAIYDDLPQKDTFLNDTFPDGFQWGFATAAYQIEGAHDVDGKGPNIWDVFTSQPGTIDDRSSGDDGCRSYYYYKEDVQLIKNMKANYYRFSIGWSRVIPTGKIADGVNEMGIKYYSNLIDELIANGIEPMITLYHWDLPQGLQDSVDGNGLGGWQNRAVVGHFKDYADLVFTRFGDRVKTWITFNEPWVFCVQGYGDGDHAPGLTVAATAPYKCAHNVLLSHAEAYHLYKDTSKPWTQGRIGITLDSAWYEPDVPGNVESEAAAKRAVIFKHGWFFKPVQTGDYPEVMKTMIAAKSLPGQSRLPEFTPDEKVRVNQTYDFLGLNHYTAELVTHTVRNDCQDWYCDQDTVTTQPAEWKPSASDWLKDTPWGFRKLFNFIKDEYNNPEVLVTENGFSNANNITLEDDGRIDYYRGYINEMLKAVKLDGCNVKAYTAWSLMDNFEWARGYTQRFGVHHVDYTSPERTRTPKKSAEILRSIFENNGFNGASSVTSILTLALPVIYALKTIF